MAPGQGEAGLLPFAREEHAVEAAASVLRENQTRKGAGPKTVTQADALALLALLERLYREQAAISPLSSYHSDHAREAVNRHHVNVFAWYLPYLSGAVTILDWGCNHGPDSCLLRKTFGTRIDLYGCDFSEESDYRAFRDYARPRYTKLTAPAEIPYDDDTFDAVVGSGVLEHTAMDLESLKELYRILRPDGVLLLSYLPYRWSLDEWYRRRVRKEAFHRRLYGMEEAATLLKRSGFYPIDIRFQTFLPNVFDGSWLSPLKRVYRRLRYHFFSHAVMCVAARKVLTM
jgi:SAM-dependent methyltransferase